MNASILKTFFESAFDDPQHLDGALRALANVEAHPDGDGILRAAVQFLDSESGREIFRQPSAPETFLRLAGQGRYPTLMLLRHPHDLAYLVEALALRPPSAAEMIDELEEVIGAVNSQETAQVRLDRVTAELRHFKRRQSLRIYHDEVEGSASVRQTTCQIADLAEACLDVAVKEIARFLGDVTLADDFCVFGMGKLGGRELNYSSDVDLIYVGADGLAADDGRRKLIEQLARRLTSIIDEATIEGYVFRVDLRLRPEGSQGPLVPLASAMVEYYQSWGRTWERSAMLKARAVAGDRSLGADVLRRLEPFLYRRSLDFSVIGELKAMKQLVNDHARIASIHGRQDVVDQEESEARPSAFAQRMKAKLKSAGVAGARRFQPTPSPTVKGTASEASAKSESAMTAADPLTGVLGWDVKLGLGGIREIEFFVQALQLVHCGSREGLRVRNTLDALDRLLYIGLLSHDDHASLADAYDLFRRLEHRVQMEEDRQGHRLPDDVEGFSLLSARMHRSPERLRQEIIDNRRRVAEMFSRLFESSEQAADRPTVKQARPVELSTILSRDPTRLFEPDVLSAFSSLGFTRPRQVAGQLQILREKSYGPFAWADRFQRSDFADYLLGACASSPEPDQAFSFLSRLILRVGDTPGFYRMLTENPHAARLLVHLFGSSPPLASILVREPDSVERLLSAGTAALFREKQAMAGDLARRLEGIHDPGHRLGRLRRFHQEETLRIALHEIAGASRLDDTLAQLSDLAEVVIEAVADEVLAGLTGPGRSVTSRKAAELPFIAVAMGKLGGRELGFGGDLDMIFVYEAREDEGLTPAFYTRLAQRLIRGLSTATESGKLYDVDMRLRPSGSQGTLVVSLEAFRRYHEDKADLWERQALVKARPMLGTSELRDAFARTRLEIVFAQPLPADTREQLASMREQLRLASAAEMAGQIDIKASPGGLLDVEFLTQYIQLELGNAPDGAEELSGGIYACQTLLALEDAARRATVERARPGGPVNDGGALDWSSLVEDYCTLRRIETRLRMSDDRGESVLPDDESDLDVLARRLGYQGREAGRQFMAEFEELRRRVRCCWEMVFAGSKSRAGRR
jgi:[glutamine synthetase] adenylyltransferase / [glutamine synthetase]-adenylyl-L-tyrosine phosphorylase